MSFFTLERKKNLAFLFISIVATTLLSVVKIPYNRILGAMSGDWENFFTELFNLEFGHSTRATWTYILSVSMLYAILFGHFIITDKAARQWWSLDINNWKRNLSWYLIPVIIGIPLLVVGIMGLSKDPGDEDDEIVNVGLPRTVAWILLILIPWVPLIIYMLVRNAGDISKGLKKTGSVMASSATNMARRTIVPPNSPFREPLLQK